MQLITTNTFRAFAKHLAPLFSLLLFILLFASLMALAEAQSAGEAAHPGASAGGGIALAPARFELEMTPGSETTVVVNLDYHTPSTSAQPSRIVASLNDWNLNETGELQFFKAGTRPNSAAPWMIYSPSEVTVLPNQTHSIRVTITVPQDAAPGDHLAALVIEQRPESIKLNKNERQMLVRLRMAAIFYITVPKVSRRGSLENLTAVPTPNGVRITPTLKNGGNSAVRPLTSVKIMDATGRVVAEVAENESLPVLAGAELSQSMMIEHRLSPGKYTVRYKVDFQDGAKSTEGVTDLVIKDEIEQRIAATSTVNQKP